MGPKVNLDSIEETFGKVFDDKIVGYNLKMTSELFNFLLSWQSNHHCECCSKRRSAQNADIPAVGTTGPSANPTTVVIGDSTMMDISTNGLAKLSGQRVFIKSTSGAVPCNVIEPEIINNAKVVVLHAGTNHLKNNDTALEKNTPEEIASEITMKLDSFSNLPNKPDVYFSAMTVRTDLLDKEKKVDGVQKLIKDTNSIVKEFCDAKQLNYIDNDDIKATDLYDGCHMNAKGATKLARNIASKIRKKTTIDNSKPHQFEKTPVEKIGERPSIANRNRDSYDKYPPRQPPYPPAGPMPWPPYPPYWPTPQETMNGRPSYKNRMTSNR